VRCACSIAPSFTLIPPCRTFGASGTTVIDDAERSARTSVCSGWTEFRSAMQMHRLGTGGAPRPEDPAVDPATDTPARFWLRLGASVLLLFLLLHGTATALGSLRGEAGLAVAALVLAGCLAAQRLLWGARFPEALRTLGLGRPSGRSLRAALAIGLALVVIVPAFAVATGSSATMFPGWLVLLPGLFAQGGVAEEVLFRGYLFGHLRRRHAFWRAALLSAVPFVAAHLLLFTTMDWPVALAATLLALVSSFPLAHLFELGGRTIWAPALVHFVIQGTVKVAELSPASGTWPAVWLAACALLPWLAFAFRR
jgi:membrane protease YdiL (CAAX protease family)